MKNFFKEGKAGFNEDDHPRDENGKFSGGNSTNPSREQHAGRAQTAAYAGKPGFTPIPDDYKPDFSVHGPVKGPSHGRPPKAPQKLSRREERAYINALHGRQPKKR